MPDPPSDPSNVFVTPHFTPDVREGDDFLFRCLLTDPSFTNLTLRVKEEEEEGPGGRGRGRDLPPGMKVSADPRVGVLIHKVDRKFNGRYVCAAWNGNDTWGTSNTLHLIVTPSKKPVGTLARPPVSLSLVYIDLSVSHSSIAHPSLSHSHVCVFRTAPSSRGVPESERVFPGGGRKLCGDVRDE